MKLTLPHLMRKLLARSLFSMATRHGWDLYSHPRFTDQFNRLTSAVELERSRGRTAIDTSANEKLRKAIRDLIYNKIPQDPTSSAYRQGKTLGPQFQHWFRAKFANGRFRLFFRYNQSNKTIVYAWVNDSESLRTYGSKTDAYAVFERLLKQGDPPNDWEQLLEASRPTEDS